MRHWGILINRMTYQLIENWQKGQSSRWIPAAIEYAKVEEPNRTRNELYCWVSKGFSCFRACDLKNYITCKTSFKYAKYFLIMLLLRYITINLYISFKTSKKVH